MEGRALADLFAGREAMFADMSSRLSALMAAEGLEYGDRSVTYNSRRAQELAAWGDELGATDALHDELFRAYFVLGLNLAEPETLVNAAKSAGLDPDEALAVVEDGRYQATISAHWRRASQAGVTGVPTFTAAGFGVVGAQPYETLEQLMARAGVPRRGL